MGRRLEAAHGPRRAVPVEILTSARALDMRDGGLATARSAPVSTAVRAAVRSVAEGPGPDRYLAPEIEAVYRLVNDGSLVAAANSVLDAPLH